MISLLLTLILGFASDLCNNKDIILILGYTQCWGRYFEKVTSYILLVTFRKTNSLHITDYFKEKVTSYSYILLFK